MLKIIKSDSSITDDGNMPTVTANNMQMTENSEFDPSNLNISGNQKDLASILLN
jgi:hypothetical protein